MLLDAVGLLVLGFIVLILSSEYLVKALTKVAVCMNLNEFMIGFMLVAVTTSIPELIIGITSALDGIPCLALGNVIGANIIVLTLVVGVIALLKRGITIETQTVKTDSFYMFAITVLPLILLLDGALTNSDGIILTGVFFLYMWRLFDQEKRFKEKLARADKRALYPNLVISLVCIALIYVSAGVVVDSSRVIAEDYLHIPCIIVGLFLISFGTTLPELTFETRAIFMRHKYMALGDLIGSVVTNSSLVLGVTSIIHPIVISGQPLVYMTAAFFLIVVAFLFTTFVEAEKHILWQEGIALIMLYVLFIIVVMNLGLFESMGGGS